MSSEHKVYLGDSVYADFDGYGIVLTTENALPTDPSNTIIMDPFVLEALARYLKRIDALRREAQKT